jgi:hypothetical protein
MGLFLTILLSIVILLIDLPVISDLKNKRSLFSKIFLSVLGTGSLGASILFFYWTIDYGISRNAKHLDIESGQWFLIVLCLLFSAAVLFTGLYALAIVFKVRKVQKDV